MMNCLQLSSGPWSKGLRYDPSLSCRYQYLCQLMSSLVVRFAVMHHQHRITSARFMIMVGTCSSQTAVRELLSDTEHEVHQLTKLCCNFSEAARVPVHCPPESGPAASCRGA